MDCIIAYSISNPQKVQALLKALRFEEYTVLRSTGLSVHIRNTKHRLEIAEHLYKLFTELRLEKPDAIELLFNKDYERMIVYRLKRKGAVSISKVDFKAEVEAVNRICF